MIETIVIAANVAFLLTLALDAAIEEGSTK